MSDRDAQPEDRENSARFLAEDGSAKALMGLLTRFDMTITGQSKDRTEIGRGGTPLSTAEATEVSGGRRRADRQDRGSGAACDRR